VNRYKAKTTCYADGDKLFNKEITFLYTVGLNDVTVRKYIQDQERADILQDKMSVKKDKDPFDAKPGADQR
jgi:transposase IS200-family protein